jgi:hypothetical protein
MKIVIVRTADHYEVRVIDDNGQITRRFAYRNLQAARRAATAWSAAYGNCDIVDPGEDKEP